MVVCLLVFMNFNHAWINGRGNQLFKYCYYDCGGPKNGGSYDKVYRLGYNTHCYQEITFADNKEKR